MVGAAATLGGVCRVTISLVVIMYELTGGLYLTPAFMIAVLAAKWVGDLFNHSIYDCVIGLRGYPYLHEPCEVTYTTRACDVMQDNLSCLPVEAGCVGDLLLDVREAPFAGYPVVQSREDMSIMGYVLTQSLRHFLEESGQDTESERVSFVGTPGTLDASSLVDNSLLLVAPDTPASQIHNIFRQMGSKTILVTKLGKLVGLITKKSFLAFLGHSHGTCTATGAGPDDLTNKDPVPQIVIDSSTYVDAYHRQTSQDSQHSHGQVMARLPKQVSFSLLAFPQRAESLQTMRREVAQEMSYHTSMRLKSNCIGPSRKSRRFKLETISWPEEMRKSVLDGRWRWFSELAFLPALIGVVAAILRGVLLWCSDRMLAIYKGSGAGSFLYASLISVLFAELSATLGWQQPCSACGISEVKTILNGFVMEEILTFEMLLCRFLGLVFTTSARLCLDFVGVLVHLSACAAELTGRWCSVRNEADRRQLLSVACAAGIASAFGAPLGGVLWSYEQMSSVADEWFLERAQLFHSRRTLFHEVEKLGSHYTFPAALDQAMFVLLGVLGGLVGACTVCSFRRRLALDTPSWKGRLSVAAVPVVAPAKAEDWGFCQHGEPVASFELAWTLLKAGYLVPSLLIGACFGRGVHVLSSLWDGAVHPGVYAMVGAAAVLVIPIFEFQTQIHQAGVVTDQAGISRNHISLVVIMLLGDGFELTGALQLVVPFMVAIMVANWVGNFFTCSLDEMQIRLRGYPLLDSKSDVVLRSRAQDIMDEELQCLTCDPCRLSVLTSLVQDSEYGGFPVVVSENNWTLLGYASREARIQSKTACIYKCL
ncbi:H(+)/Cl(-) exchange transporter 3 (Chloride channel protein 3) (ClC-3) (Chloride transporter ClC-3) [Durusdinium trenchii]|uniref:H(+)/Cl(-) exchange transporter 3 (Chloride channel protein 3) (ClC-3) (Chloride transporter ClC-3) n=1 Tax=Durusdinium trenchii TaxID=1381693 RepID=A0ABP0P5T2_9DINO